MGNVSWLRMGRQARLTDRYFAGEAPWALAKTDPVRQGTVLYVTAEVIRQVGLFDERFVGIGGYEDWDWNRRCLNAGYRVVLTPRSALHPPSCSSTHSLLLLQVT
jgi:GT2 family glycosyltransferase